MKVIVDIPNWLYNAIMEHKEPHYSKSLGEAVRDGTPLPKGHGRLVDGDALRNEMIQTFKKYCNANAWDVCVECVRLADTIIAADKGGE